MEGELGSGGMAASIIQIIFFDLILSGDNAVVIGVVAGRLQGRQRRTAILFGAGAAVVLRIGFAAIATILFKTPALAAVGGAALFYIGWRLVQPEPEGDAGHREASSLREAIQLIILADVVMSLDNVLAIAGAAHGDVGLLIFGLAVSMPLLFVGAQLIAVVADRAPLVIYLGSGLVFRIGFVLILEDPLVAPLWEENFVVEHILPWVVGVAGPAAYVIQAKLRRRPTISIMVNPFAESETADSVEA
ncbi:MAG: TerC family protein [Chloroflexota bacterium]|nr:TerC family protein [Chloroflexota bacterium]